jgi:hypothetical protein
VRGAQPLLALDPDLAEQDVAAVAEELLVVQAGKGGRKLSSAWGSWRLAWSPPPRASGP